MKLIIGLGNPGFKYTKTRHNVGFRVIDELAKRHHVKVNKKEKEALTGSFRYQGEKVILVKPQTYMNNSGEAVGKLARWYDIEPVDIIIIYDDLDLEVGRLRIKNGGGHGGHNGMRSIINHLSSKQIARIKIGIGRPPEYMTVSDYVLGKFDKDNRKQVQQIILTAAKAVEVALEEDLETAMNEYN
ncbi:MULTISPECIES: aminoacyl-tRNA hydrolase [unclassified Candidatus Frackibacter]|uniref:aminoacyl-tRNA hydrolase n=1 Tax=unclassified Candidatus Frackibacter TaxID=2648818 RepID=UPI000796A9B6|nr:MULTISPECIES: aminoacyl-tRNA hydrolase [unclassified Candidatus Frackibacter]KXS45680.1 MAG: peptidyl-tRNA hydrolase, PTH1 family [Candidatus Frackibacter sp. T328-2]SDC66385.1 peptidyl-tRNA hydrolase [Candidatus Frackibacter sp. WG11]SEM79542.1 peptidyl-tRNA hydrolase [Candidatus Frackibacter sp. WG12]SFL90252.1 peptidyl-tRNA hydrolase [Candidatus Frackibacter sp. WG13]